MKQKLILTMTLAVTVALIFGAVRGLSIVKVLASEILGISLPPNIYGLLTILTVVAIAAGGYEIARRLQHEK